MRTALLTIVGFATILSLPWTALACAPAPSCWMSDGGSKSSYLKNICRSYVQSGRRDEDICQEPEKVTQFVQPCASFGFMIKSASQGNNRGVGEAVTNQDSTLRFRTPSNQIHCMFSSIGVACEINQTFIKTPIRPRPKDCEYDWGHFFELADNGEAGLGCVSDSVSSDDSRVLGYGSYIKNGRITCFSEDRGLTCSNDIRHGFIISRQSQRLF